MCVSVSADQFVHNFSILSHQAASAVNFTLILFLSKAPASTQSPPSYPPPTIFATIALSPFLNENIWIL